MTIRHHVSEELLYEYAAGRLGETWSVAIATHLALCPECRMRERLFDSVGGNILDASAPATMAHGSLDACMALIEANGSQEPAHSQRTTETPARPVFPEPLRGYAGGDLDTVPWSKVGGGVRQKIISAGTDATASCRLLYIPPGQAVPEHGHRGLELTLVLAGSFSDGDATFARGDLEIADEEVEHMPIAGMDGPCICLAVTDAPLRFKSWLPRLAQRFIKI
jgi:putative transcriptional regulator